MKTGSVGSSAGSDPTGARLLDRPSKPPPPTPVHLHLGEPRVTATTTAPSRPAVTSRPPGHATMAPAPPSPSRARRRTTRLSHPTTSTRRHRRRRRRGAAAATSSPIAALRTPPERSTSLACPWCRGEDALRTDRSAAIAANFPSPPRRRRRRAGAPPSPTEPPRPHPHGPRVRRVPDGAFRRRDDHRHRGVGPGDEELILARPARGDGAAEIDRVRDSGRRLEPPRRNPSRRTSTRPSRPRRRRGGSRRGHREGVRGGDGEPDAEQQPRRGARRLVHTHDAAVRTLRRQVGRNPRRGTRRLNTPATGAARVDPPGARARHEVPAADGAVRAAGGDAAVRERRRARHRGRSGSRRFSPRRQTTLRPPRRVPRLAARRVARLVLRPPRRSRGRSPRDPSRRRPTRVHSPPTRTDVAASPTSPTRALATKRPRAVPRVEPQRDDAAAAKGDAAAVVVVASTAASSPRWRPRARARASPPTRAPKPAGGATTSPPVGFKLFHSATHPLGDVRGRRHHPAVGAGAHQQTPPSVPRHTALSGDHAAAVTDPGATPADLVAAVPLSRRQLIPRALDGVDRRRRVGAQRCLPVRA